jgi:NitT/TauT family transport system permease protein
MSGPQDTESQRLKIDQLVPDDVIPHGTLPPLRYRDLPDPIPLRKMVGPSIILAGLALGFTLATALGYAVAKSPALEKALTPYLVASQAVPVVAIAPLLIIWFGAGQTSKVLICALITFFPILVNTILGVRSVEPDLRDLMRSLKATPWQTFIKLELPAALPVLLSGLKIGATLAVIGAVVGEFAGADRGLGFLISIGRNQYDTALVFVGVAALVVMALALYGSVAVMERVWLQWKRN